VATAPLLVLRVVTVASATIARRSSGTALSSAVTKPMSAPICNVRQLHFAYYGASSAAGTAVTGIKVTDASRAACYLIGSPTMKFFTGTGRTTQLLDVRVAHAGTGVAFAAQGRPVLLKPATSAASASGGAGVVMTSADSGLGGTNNCPHISLISLGIGRDESVGRAWLWYPSNACGQPVRLTVSSFFPGADLDAYVTKMIYPLCSRANLEIGLGRGGVAMSHVGLAITFRNISEIPCRISGYPVAALFGAVGHGVLVAKQRPNGYLGGLLIRSRIPPLVNLLPGQTASTLLEGVDGYGNDLMACRASSSIHLAIPYLGISVDLLARFGGCATVEIHPIVPGKTGTLAKKS